MFYTKYNKLSWSFQPLSKGLDHQNEVGGHQITFEVQNLVLIIGFYVKNIWQNWKQLMHYVLNFGKKKGKKTIIFDLEQVKMM